MRNLHLQVQHYALLVSAALSGPVGIALVESLPPGAVKMLVRWVWPVVMVLYVFMGQLQQSPKQAKVIQDALQPDPDPPKPPPLPPLALLCLALGALSCAQPSTPAADGVLAMHELACVDQAATLADSRVCRNAVRRAWAKQQGITITDVPAPDGGRE